MERVATIGGGLLSPMQHHGHQSPSISSPAAICLRRRHHAAAGAAAKLCPPVLNRQHRGALASTTASRSEGSPKSSQSLIESCYTAYDTLKQGIAASAIPDDDKKRMKSLSSMQGPKAWTYGEISYSGVVTLKGLLSPCSGTFYDLGSGFARMVLQVYLEWGLEKAVGVELSLDRHTRAEAAAQRLLGKLDWDPAGKLELRNDNILETDLGDATIVYLACTCWDADFMNAVVDKLKQDSQKLQWVISSENLETEFNITTLEDAGWKLEHTVSVPMSWDDSWPVYVYRCGC